MLAGAHYKYGNKLKKKEGVDLGNVKREGIAYYGNFDFRHEGQEHEQDDSIFLVNMERAILEHCNVLLHELTHHFHFTIGETCTPRLTEVYNKALEVKTAMQECYSAQHSMGIHAFQHGYDYTFSCPEEFLAYMVEAYYSKPEEFSQYGLHYSAPAFPCTRKELVEIDIKYGLGIVEMVNSYIPLRP